MDLDTAASTHFRFRDFIRDAGETSGKVPNLPENPATFAAMRRLAWTILEPLYDVTGGDVVITYGFCSPARAKLVRKWGTYQKGDQHAGEELNRNGDRICPRGGFAVDVRTASSAAAALELIDLEWDRIYFYGDDRPLHVSIAPEDRPPARSFVDMRRYPEIPKPLAVRDPVRFLRGV